MKERGILFKGELVRAILEGRKTQTRRLINPQPTRSLPNTKTVPTPSGEGLDIVHPLGMRWQKSKHSSLFVADSKGLDTFAGLLANSCPYGRVGDRLWVRETWNFTANHEIASGVRESHVGPCYEYAADYEEPGRGWRPSLLMPRRASRITLELTGVRAERLHDMSEADAKAEGVTTAPVPAMINGKPGTACPMTHRQAFIWLWDSINGKKGAPWASNLWVWALEFKVVEVRRAAA